MKAFFSTRLFWLGLVGAEAGAIGGGGVGRAGATGVVERAAPPHEVSLQDTEG